MRAQMNGVALHRFEAWALSAIVAALLLWAAPVRAYTPPPQQAQHVVDSAHKLVPAEKAKLEQKLESFRLATKRDIVVFLASSLEGENVEDAAYETFKAWKLGEKGADTGVLLLISTGERKVRIETGKGVGGELTDAQCGAIIREKIAPPLKEDRFYDAVSAGTDAIALALNDGKAPAVAAPRPAPSPGSVFAPLLLAALGILLLIAVFIGVDQYLRARGHKGISRGVGNGGARGGRSGGGGSGSSGGYGGGGGGESGGGGASGGY